MTRVNCIDPELLLDQWLQAHLREGLRPVNERLSGRPYHNAPSHYKLGSGHCLFHRKHCEYTLNLWLQAKKEYDRRGYQGFDWKPPVEAVRALQTEDYIPSVADKRLNLARLIVRWRKNPSLYTFCKNPVHTRQQMRDWVEMVKTHEELENGE